jgi:hypothetical protein
VIQAQVDRGQRRGATSEELAEIKDLKAKVRRLEEDNERQYFPKGTDLCRYSEDELDAVAPTHSTADPARLLDWATPAEALNRLLSGRQSSGVASTP